LNRKVLFLIVIPLLLGIVVSVSFQVPTVAALVPSIESVSFHDDGSTTVVDIAVNHVGSPTPIGSGHYVSNIQLEINGTVVDLPQSPQSTETFTVQYSLGPNTDTYTVRARALCNLHGYSAQSNPVTIPESISIVMFIALTTFMVVVAKKTFGRRARNA
jgi:desulfoferrodoxin (superoxide reductase-like protein)